MQGGCGGEAASGQIEPGAEVVAQAVGGGLCIFPPTILKFLRIKHLVYCFWRCLVVRNFASAAHEFFEGVSGVSHWAVQRHPCAG